MARALIVVRDAKTGEDITRAILLQIILEEEAGGAPMFTEAVLANIIRFYGHAMQGFMGNYLKNIQPLPTRLAQQSAGMTPEMWDAVHGRWARPDGQLRRATRPVRANASKPSNDGRLWHQALNARVGENWEKWRPMSQAPLPPHRHAPHRYAKIGFVSLGCPKNLTDSEPILTQLSAGGYQTSKPSGGGSGHRQHLRLH